MRELESHTLTSPAQFIRFGYDLTTLGRCDLKIIFEININALNGADVRLTTEYRTGGVWAATAGSTTTSQQKLYRATSNSATVNASFIGIMFDTTSTLASSMPFSGWIRYTDINSTNKICRSSNVGDQVGAGAANRIHKSRSFMTTPSSGIGLDGIGITLNAANGMGIGTKASLCIL